MKSYLSALFFSEGLSDWSRFDIGECVTGGYFLWVFEKCDIWDVFSFIAIEMGLAVARTNNMG